MGVPGLFSYLARKYPKVVEPVSSPPAEEAGEHETPYNNLYIGELSDLPLCVRSQVSWSAPRLDALVITPLSSCSRAVLPVAVPQAAHEA